MIGTPDGDLLGDEARRAVIDALLSMPPGDSVAAIDWPTGTAGEPELLVYEDDIADAAIRTLNPVVAALVSQAREAGAAEERERIADEIGPWTHPKQTVSMELIQRLLDGPRDRI